jgi:hypothetical protein
MAGQHEVQRKRRFSRASRPFDDIHPSAQQSAAEKRVEAFDARRRPGGLGRGAACVLLRRGMLFSRHVTIPCVEGPSEARQRWGHCVP